MTIVIVGFLLIALKEYWFDLVVENSTPLNGAIDLIEYGVGTAGGTGAMLRGEG